MRRQAGPSHTKEGALSYGVKGKSFQSYEFLGNNWWGTEKKNEKIFKYIYHSYTLLWEMLT